ncbi:MAG: GNAT family N-acetyltransferase [Myxococcota bacterium]
MIAVVRPASVLDAESIARVHLSSSDEAYSPLAGRWPTVSVDERRASWEKWLGEGARVFVAEADGAVVGFASGGGARRLDLGADVELTVIHVRPENRGQGVGAALWNATCDDIRGPELKSMIVRTLAALRVNAFYQRNGGIEVARESKDFYGARRDEVTYRWGRGASHR